MSEHKPPTLGELYTVHLVQELAELRQQLATMQAEREQYKAALGRALPLLAEYAHDNKADVGWYQATNAILADLQGQQAAAEWQWLTAVAEAAREHEDAKARYNQAMRERDFDVAAAARSDELYAHTALLAALAALQPPPPPPE